MGSGDQNWDMTSSVDQPADYQLFFLWKLGYCLGYHMLPCWLESWMLKSHCVIVTSLCTTSSRSSLCLSFCLSQAGSGNGSFCPWHSCCCSGNFGCYVCIPVAVLSVVAAVAAHHNQRCCDTDFSTTIGSWLYLAALRVLLEAQNCTIKYRSKTSL